MDHEKKNDEKLAICPKCGKKIDHLRALGYVPIEREFNLIPNESDFHWGEADTNFEEVFNEFICPECGMKVASSQDEAIKLLKGSVHGKRRGVIGSRANLVNCPKCKKPLTEICMTSLTEADLMVLRWNPADEFVEERNISDDRGTVVRYNCAKCGESLGSYDQFHQGSGLYNDKHIEMVLKTAYEESMKLKPEDRYAYFDDAHD